MHLEHYINTYNTTRYQTTIHKVFVFYKNVDSFFKHILDLITNILSESIVSLLCSKTPTANVAGGINALICPTSIEQSASPYVVHGQRSVRWITSLAGGSSCWGPNEVAGRGPRHTPPPSPQTALKWCATQRPRLSPFMSVTARRSEDTCDDIVVSAYEED